MILTLNFFSTSNQKIYNLIIFAKYLAIIISKIVLFFSFAYNHIVCHKKLQSLSILISSNDLLKYQHWVRENDYISFHMKYIKRSRRYQAHILARETQRYIVCLYVSVFFFVGTSDYAISWVRVERRIFSVVFCILFISCHDKAIFILELKFFWELL